MRVFISGGTGTIGSAIIGTLANSDVRITVLTRDKESTERRFPNVAAFQGSFLDPFAMLPVLREQDAMILLLPVVPTEVNEGLNAVALAKEAGVKKIIYISVQQTLMAPYDVPHIGSKLLIERAIRGSGIPFVILRPSVFMQNDYWYRDALTLHGRYPQPLGDYGVSSCDIRDISDAVVSGLADGSHEDQCFTVAGPDLITGHSAAAVWADALGKTVSYGGSDLDAWSEAQLGFGMPPWMVYDLKLMYHAWQKDGLEVSQAERDRLTSLLGRPPRTYSSFVRETAQKWSGVLPNG